MAPAWITPDLPLQHYRPVRNLWELPHFRWQTGSAVSLKDILENGWLPVYCTVDGHALVVAMPILDFWDVPHPMLIPAIPVGLNANTKQAEAMRERIRSRIIKALDPDTEEPTALSAGGISRLQAPPILPKLSQAEQLNQPEPEFKCVYL